MFILPTLTAGGAERVAVTYLRQLNRAEQEIYLIVLDDAGLLKTYVPSDIRFINLNTRKASLSFWALIKLLKEVQPDTVFTTHSRLAFLVKLAKTFSPKFKHIARMQNTPSLEKEYKSYGILKRWLYSVGFKSADIVIAQTEAMKVDAVRIFGLERSKIEVLHNPIDAEYIIERSTEHSSPFSKDKFNAVASGRLTKAKGFDLLIKALPDVIKMRPEFKLYILGSDQGERSSLERLVHDLELCEVVTFLGGKENPYVYYKSADLFILPSRYEGFPNVLIENYILNKPIVATKCVPIVGELIQEGVSGYLCEVGDVGCLARKIIDSMAASPNLQIDNHYQSSSIQEFL